MSFRHRLRKRHWGLARQIDVVDHEALRAEAGDDRSDVLSRGFDQRRVDFDENRYALDTR